MPFLSSDKVGQLATKCGESDLKFLSERQVDDVAS